MTVPTPRRLSSADPQTIPTTQLGAFTFNSEGGAGRPAIQVESNLPYINLVNNDAGVHTFNCFPRATGGENDGVVKIPIGSGQCLPVPTIAFSLIVDSAPNGNCYAFYSDVPLGFSPSGGAGGGFSGEVVAQNGVAAGNSQRLFGAFSPLNHLIGTDANGRLYLQGPGGTTNGVTIDTNGSIRIGLDSAPTGAWFDSGKFGIFGGVACALDGVFHTLGTPDNRIGVNATDGAAKTLYTTANANPLLKLSARVLIAAGAAGSSATYQLKWTEGGNVLTVNLSPAALDAHNELSILIQPDAGTAITAQVTAIAGVGAALDVAAIVSTVNSS